MRQSYFIWVILLWFIGNHFVEGIQSDYGRRLYVNVSTTFRGDRISRKAAFNKLQDPANSDLTRLYVNKEAAIGGDGSSWVNAFKYLQDALAAAGSGTEIWVAQGLYFPDEGNGLADNDRDLSFNMKNGVAIYGGFTGTEADISERDWHANRTYLSGDLQQNGTSYFIESNTGTTTNYEDNSYHVVRSEQTNETARLDGFLIAAGNANGGGSENNLGGGMYAVASSMSLVNCEFRNNLAVLGGGLFQTQSSLYIDKCIFRANSVGSGGGGVYIYNGSGSYVYNCVFQANYVNENTAVGSGGGVYINQNSNPQFINCTFSGNYARTGGAVSNVSNATPIFYNTIIWKNATGLPRAFHADQVVSDPTSSADYYNSILQFIDLPDPSNLDGTDPQFKFDLFSNIAPGYLSDLRLEKCSPAIDKGNNGYIASSTDLGDSVRFVNGTVDLGAYEFQGVNERVWYQDLDGDTWGNSSVTIISCTQPPGYVDRGGDCNDIPSDNIFTDGRAVNPGMQEICGDLQDNDCNGLVDDIYTYYRDADQDGLGNPSNKIGSCSENPPEGYVSNHDDCNDSDPSPNAGSIVYVNVNATGPIYDGSAWTSAYKNLQDALTYACPNTTQIWVAQGTYYPDQGIGKVNDARYETFVLRNGLAIYGGFAGGETQLSQRSWKDNATILSGDIDGDETLSGNSWHVVFNDENNLTNTSRLDGFHIIGGNASGYNFIGDEKPYQAGAGMYNKNSFPTVANCVFENNSSWSKGGAVYNWSTGPSNTSIYENCSFMNNNVAGGTNASGGAMYNEEVGAKMINCVFFGNQAQFRGGAIYNYGTSGITTVTNCAFYGNISTTPGKDISNFSEGSGNITNCIFWGDNLPIYEFLANHLTVSHSIFQQTSVVYAGTGNLNVDPLFVDQGAGNLRLQAGSPAINAGDDAANNTSYDLDVNPRKIGTIDIGAYEFGSSTPGCTDEIAPSFTSNYDDINLGCNPADPDGSLGTATATDASGAVTITSIDDPAISDGCNFSKTRTFTAKDGCNNTSTVSRTVRWKFDNTDPVISLPGGIITLGCNPTPEAVEAALGIATASDGCGSVTLETFNASPSVSGLGPCERAFERVFKATDACGNWTLVTRRVEFKVDRDAPQFIGSYTDVNLGCNAADPTASLGTATATDACGALAITHIDGELVSDGNNRSITRTFTAEDGCGNTSTVSRTIKWTSDNTPATFTGSYADVNLGCNPADPFASLGSATATDAYGNVSITYADGEVMNSGCNRSITRTFTAKDGCDNTSTMSRTVKWIADNTPATFTGSYADINLGCNPANPTGSLGSATATDAGGAVTITPQDGLVVSSGCNRSVTRTFTAKDECNNTSTTSRTVRWIADLTPPTFTGYNYADVNLGCNPANPDGSLGTATATDGCSDVTITSSDGAVQSNGCNRARTRTFTATDGCLNTSTTSRTVRWISDVTPPAFTGSYTDVNLGCNPANPDGSLGTATATDGCGAVTITSSDGAVQSNGCNRARTRTFTATDGCLNTSTTSRTVRWKADITPPSFTGYYSDVNLNCNPANPDGSLGTATATDGCGAVTITSSDGAVQSNGCNRSRTRTFTATDGCLNTSTTSRTVRWIYDVTAPTLVCAKTGTVTKSTNAGLCTYAVYGTEFNSTASDACSTPLLAWSVSGATTSSGNATMAGVLLNFGNNTIKWTATDACGNTSTCSFIVNVNKVTTTTSLVVSTTPVTNPVTQQYSDKITCVATVTPASCTNAGPIGGTVTFKIINAQGTVVLGTAPVASDGTATLTDTLIENQFYPGATNLLPSNGPLKPGNKTVTAEYSSTDPDYIVTNPTAPLVVNCEDAEITYNGLNYFGANPNTNEGTITVSAFVLDTNDVNDVPAQARGDIRNATVTFKEGTSGGAAIGTANIPVGLVNPTNFQEGIVTTNKTYTLTTQDINCGGKIVDVWAGVNNYYCGEIAEVVPVCLSLPGGDFVTGGGWIKMLNSEGSYAGIDDMKMHAALAFKWNKSNKNLQGNATIVYKRVVNGVQKVYQVKSNSITSMIVNNVNDAGTVVGTGATYRMAQIVTKANFRDITDPELPVALFGNLTLTITAWESIATTDGSKDRISVELVGSGSQGLIFSSNWLSGATQWQQLNSGKMRVRNPSAEIPCTNCSGSGITAKPGEVDKATETIPVTGYLKVTVMPNPSNTNFRITVDSHDLKEPVKLLVTDMLGRVIDTRITNAGQTIKIGDKYISGTYAVRIIQGRKIKQLALIKLSD